MFAELLCMSVLFHVDHLLPCDGPPVADAAVVMADDGRVVDVGAAADVLPRHQGVKVERVQGIAFPGLVNAHTHVELSGLRGKVPGGRGFVPWVEALIGVRWESSSEDDTPAIEAAVEDLARFATVAVGEVTNSLSAVAALARRGIGGAVFHEVFGHDRSAVMTRVAALRTELDERLPRWPTADLTYAPAAHTLYTTHADAVRAALDAARGWGIPTSLHLAEHPGERRAIETGEGPVVAWLEARTKQRPVWPNVPLFDYAESLGALRPGVLLVHLADARPAELDRVAASGAAVVLCPRSNLYIETRLPPLLAVRSAGIAAALGTDSLTSSPSLDVLAEARALGDRFPSVPAWELVQMATRNGAQALGRADLGVVARGARPGLYAVLAPGGSDPAAALLRHLASPRVVLAPRTPEVAA